MRSEEAKIAILKEQWLADPCWDIENTSGYEKYRKDLYIFRLETENRQMREQCKQDNEFRRQLRKFVGIEEAK